MAALGPRNYAVAPTTTSLIRRVATPTSPWATAAMWWWCVPTAPSCAWPIPCPAATAWWPWASRKSRLFRRASGPEMWGTPCDLPVAEGSPSQAATSRSRAIPLTTIPVPDLTWCAANEALDPPDLRQGVAYKAPISRGTLLTVGISAMRPPQ